MRSMNTKMFRVVWIVGILLLLLGVAPVQAFYNSVGGRWLSRDPVGELGSQNLYALTKNNALTACDVLGLWNADVHKGRTTQWAGQLGIDAVQSENIGAADDGVDTVYSTMNFDDWNWGWHFNRSRSGDSRLVHKDAEFKKAMKECSKWVDNPYNAAHYLGRALHPLQDWVAHGDFNRKVEEPSLTGFWPWEKRYYWHNWDALSRTFGLYGPGDPDNPEMDTDGWSGRATIDTLKRGTLLSNGDQAYWTGFHGGHARINLTETLSKGLLSDFQIYVLVNGKRCGECWKAFLGRITQ